MSGWDAYITHLLGDKSVVTGAAIYGKPASANAAPGLWATSAATFISAEEAKSLVGGIISADAFNGLSATGFRVGGTKYMKINSEEGLVIRGKQGEYAAAAAASGKAVIIAVGKGAPQDISNRAEKMAADLKSKGF